MHSSASQLDEEETPFTDDELSLRRHHVSPCERHMLPSRRNRRFETTIGRNTIGAGAVEGEGQRPPKTTDISQDNYTYRTISMLCFVANIAIINVKKL